MEIAPMIRSVSIGPLANTLCARALIKNAKITMKQTLIDPAKTSDGWISPTQDSEYATNPMPVKNHIRIRECESERIADSTTMKNMPCNKDRCSLSSDERKL